MTKRVQIIVSGKVQGVYFRASAQNKAKQLGIIGFAKNLPNGSVEIIAEGKLSALEQFITWCHNGPSLARVNDVLIADTKNSDLFVRFEIR